MSLTLKNVVLLSTYEKRIIISPERKSRPGMKIKRETWARGENLVDPGIFPFSLKFLLPTPEEIPGPR